MQSTSNNRYEASCTYRSGRERLEAEFAELQAKIAEYKAILADENKL